MPVLKMYIDNEIADTLPISFAGLDKDERPAHVEGLSQWMKQRNYVQPGSHYEIFLDQVESAANEILKKERAAENQYLKQAEQQLKANDGRKNPAKRKNVQKAVAMPELPLKPFQHVKGEYSNKNWWEEEI